MLQRYGTSNHEAGVTEFALLPDAILLLFHNGAAYLYTNDVPDAMHVERMRALATQGRGLNTYVSRFVGKHFAQMLSAAEVAAVRAEVRGTTSAPVE